MTSQEYTQWLKGFLDAVDNYAITKKQFDSIREKLKEVDDTPQSIGNPIGNGGWWGTTPYSIPLSGTITTGGTITTSNYPSGSTLTYTTGNGGVSSYTLGHGTITSTNTAYVNQSSDNEFRSKYLKDSEGYESLEELENDFFGEYDEKLLLD
jgi:hypothetical protein